MDTYNATISSFPTTYAVSVSSRPYNYNVSYVKGGSSMSSGGDINGNLNIYGDLEVVGNAVFSDGSLIVTETLSAPIIDQLQSLKGHKASVQTLRVHNYYTEAGYIDLNLISPENIFEQYAIDPLTVDTTYPVWQSDVNDVSRCLLYRNVDGDILLHSPYLNQGNAILGSGNIDIRLPWEMDFTSDDNVTVRLPVILTDVLVAPEASYVPFAVQAAPLQTANLQEWRDDAGAVLSNISSDGSLTVSSISAGQYLGISSNYLPLSGGTILSPLSTITPLTIQGATGQTANLLELKNAAGDLMLHVDIYNQLKGVFNVQTAYMWWSENLIGSEDRSAIILGKNNDTWLRRDAPNTLALKNSTNPQALNIYNTTDGTNYERGFVKWDSNVLKIGTEAGGTGSVRNIALAADGGSVGIGTTSPTAALHILSGATYKSKIESTTADNYNQFISATGLGEYGIWDNALYFQSLNLANGIRFYYGNNVGIQMLQSGNVGIGTTTPNEKLTVAGNLKLSDGVGGEQILLTYGTIGNYATGLQISSYNNPVYIQRNNGSVYMAGGQGQFTTGGNVLLVAETVANVGIGTTTPTQRLDVAGTISSAYGNSNRSGTIKLGGADSNQHALIHFDYAVANYLEISTLYNHADNRIYISPAGVRAITAMGSGNVGIGTTTPVAKLDVVGNAYFRNIVGGEWSGYGIQIETNSNAPRINFVYNGTFGGSLESNGTTSLKIGGRLNIDDTWNNALTTFTALKLNVTDTASAAGSLLMDLQVGGVSKFKVAKSGQVDTGLISSSSAILAASYIAGTSFYASAGVFSFGYNNDAVLNLGGIGIIAQRNGLTPQQYQLFNTYTDSTNYERAFMRWNSNVFEIGTEAGSVGGVVRNTRVASGDCSLILNGGDTYPTAWIGSNAYTGLLFAHNAVINLIGQLSNSGDSLRIFGDYLNPVPLRLGVETGIGWTDGIAAYNTVDTTIYRGASAGMIAFQGRTSSFPALKRNAATLEVRLADDSGYAGLVTGGLSASNIRLTDTVWDDIRITSGGFDFTNTTADPTLVDWVIGSITLKAWQFDKDDSIYVSAQMPHSYKPGTDLKVHVHWTPGSRGVEERNSYVGWKADITSAQYGTAFANISTLDLSNMVPADCVDNQHLIGGSVTYTPPVGFAESGMVMMRVYRSDTGADDTWVTNTSGNLPLLLEVDIHHQIDKLGSDDETPT